MVTIADMVRAQRHLIDHLGIDRLLAVVGGSMGGMQVLQWAVSYPERVRAAIPLATTARHSPMLIAFNEVGRQAIYADPNWNGGDYYDGPRPNAGLALARMIGHITYLSESLHAPKVRPPPARTPSLTGTISRPSSRSKATCSITAAASPSALTPTATCILPRPWTILTWRTVTATWQPPSSTAAEVLYLVVSFTSDWLYPPYHSKELVTALSAVGADVSYCNLQSTWGHDAFLLEVETMTRVLSDFLTRLTQTFSIQPPAEGPTAQPSAWTEGL